MSFGAGSEMTLRIERVQARIRLIGEFRSEYVDQVKAEIECCRSPVILDLEELVLVDVECIRFLNGCEANGISVQRRSAFIREWMLQERARANKS